MTVAIITALFIGFCAGFLLGAYVCAPLIPDDEEM